MRARLWIMMALLSCGGEKNPSAPTESVPASLRIIAGNGQSAVASTSVPVAPTIEVADSSGRPIGGVAVSFDVLQGDGWVVTTRVTTDVQGRASTDWYLGPVPAIGQSLEARVGTLSAVFNATGVRPTAGTVQVGFNSFIEWISGDLPIVISAPHGGTLLPTEIPDRTIGTTTRDLNTEELARAVADAFVARYGRRPHMVICRLSRQKLDANREIVEAAAGNPFAERAWREYHGYLEASAAEVRRGSGLGFYVDLHGHGHDIQRLELGYLVSAGKLSLTDPQLALDLTMQSSSLWPIAETTGASFPAVLRGSNSLGAYLEAAGYPSVPSPGTPSPGNNPYFEGGYSTERHGTSVDRRFAGVQIEANLDGVRDSAASRAAFAAALVSALDSFLRAHGAPLQQVELRRAG